MDVIESVLLPKRQGRGPDQRRNGYTMIVQTSENPNLVIRVLRPAERKCQGPLEFWALPVQVDGTLAGNNDVAQAQGSITPPLRPP